MPDDFIPPFSDEYFETSGEESPKASPRDGDRVSWAPMKRGGSNFKTHTLKLDGESTARFTSSVQSKLFSGVFVVLGLLVFVIGGINIFFIDPPMEGAWALFLFGLVFGGAGILITLAMNRPLTFDKSKGLFWRGKLPEDIHGPFGKTWARLESITAIQLLSERVSGSEDSYHSYEINLVIEDRDRVHVVDHGHAEQIREDAEKLAYFLGVPLWDRR